MREKAKTHINKEKQKKRNVINIGKNRYIFIAQLKTHLTKKNICI